MPLKITKIWQIVKEQQEEKEENTKMQMQELRDLNELALYKKRELYYLVNAYQTENWEFVVLPSTCLTTTEAN